MEQAVPKILCVDDEPNILQAFKRQLRGKFDLEVASDPNAALELLVSHGPFAVVVSDMRMPGLDGVQFLNEIEKRSPETVRVMISGNAERATPMKAINDGRVFKFLSKPCSIGELESSLSEAYREYQAQKAERDLLNNTLGGCIKLLTDVISLLAPARFNVSRRAREVAQELLPRSGLKTVWEVNLAIMLADLGLVTMPAEIQVVADGVEEGSVSASRSKEQKAFEQLPQISASLITNIPRCEGVGEAILYHAKNFDGSGFPADGRKGEEIPLASRFIKIVRAVAAAELKGGSRRDALTELLKSPNRYDANLVSRLLAVPLTNAPEAVVTKYPVTVRDLCVGQVLMANVVDKDGRLLIAEGATVSEVMISRLKNYANLVGIVEPILVNSRIPTRRSVA